MIEERLSWLVGKITGINYGFFVIASCFFSRTVATGVFSYVFCCLVRWYLRLLSPLEFSSIVSTCAFVKNWWRFAAEYPKTNHCRCYSAIYCWSVFDCSCYLLHRFSLPPFPSGKYHTLILPDWELPRSMKKHQALRFWALQRIFPTFGTLSQSQCFTDWHGVAS